MTIVRVDGGLFYSRIYVQIPGYASVLNGSGNFNQISKSPLKTGVATLYQTGVNGNASCNITAGT